jgi:hypothetical protein
MVQNYRIVYEEQLEKTILDKTNLHRNKKELINSYNNEINTNYLKLEKVNDQLAHIDTILRDGRIKYNKENVIATNLGIFISVFLISSAIYIIFYTFFTEESVSNYINQINNRRHNQNQYNRRN